MARKYVRGIGGASSASTTARKPHGRGRDVLPREAPCRKSSCLRHPRAPPAPDWLWHAKAPQRFEPTPARVRRSQERATAPARGKRRLLALARRGDVDALTRHVAAAPARGSARRGGITTALDALWAPVSQNPAEIRQLSSTTARTGSTGPPPEMTAVHRRILVVDDVPDQRRRAVSTSCATEASSDRERERQDAARNYR